jgi:deoxyribonuclease-4
VILGAHVSIAGGIANAPANAAACTCDTFQIFSKNQLQWQAPALTRQEVGAFRTAMRESHMTPGTVHASYLVNLAARDEDLLRKSRACMVADLRRTELLGIPYLVVHPGAHRRQGMERGLELVAESLDDIFRHSTARRTMVLLETTSGAGSVLGSTFEQLAAIRSMTRFARRVGICVDTCHLFAAGYDIRTSRGLHETLAQLDGILGLAWVRAVHLNDSKGDLGSHIDRHAEIGQGALGIEVFRHLVNDHRFASVPGILETPGGEEAFVHNLALLRSLRR